MSLSIDNSQSAPLRDRESRIQTSQDWIQAGTSRRSALFWSIFPLFPHSAVVTLLHWRSRIAASIAECESARKSSDNISRVRRMAVGEYYGQKEWTEHRLQPKCHGSPEHSPCPPRAIWFHLYGYNSCAIFCVRGKSVLLRFTMQQLTAAKHFCGRIWTLTRLKALESARNIYVAIVDARFFKLSRYWYATVKNSTIASALKTFH